MRKTGEVLEFMDVYGCSMSVYGCLWVFMDVYGCLWVFMDVYGCSMGVYGELIGVTISK